MKKDLRKNQKTILKKKFRVDEEYRVWKYYVRKHRYIKLVTTVKRRNYLTSEPNYCTRKYFTEHLLKIERNLSI